ncbi:MAG TPA: VWA domain-containing protein [Solirubrobacteraceae bacterium]|nr:VWA domain-containing protein [Solirubrobacteraceae bacterium]
MSIDDRRAPEPPSMPPFPLSAIVGQEPLLEALLICAVSPEVGGVLIRGQRGSAKSTAVRALEPLLDGRLVEVPLGTTLDRLLGSIDLRRALAHAEHAFEPGLLARAHRGILYVDEVNLLPDHLVDALLDAAASGVARVERDSVSVAHAARFVLVGTMNVEEGELRPQLLDRFGLGVEVRGPTDPAVRAEVVRRRLAFERDPAAFVERFAEREQALAERVRRARLLLDGVRLPERELLRITSACARLGIDGVRGDIVWSRAARTLAALNGADEVSAAHVRRAGELALAHRLRRDPLGGDEAPSLERALDGPEDEPPDPSAPDRAPGPSASGASTPDAWASGARPPGARPPQASRGARWPRGIRSGVAEGDAEPGDGGGEAGDAREGPHPAAPADRAGAPSVNGGRREAPVAARLPLGALALEGAGRGPHGRRAKAAGAGAGAIDSRPAAEDDTDIAIVATLRARELRANVRAGREGVLLCLVIDASGSMAARRRLARVRGALIGLLRDAYARRDRVAVIAFREREAHLLVAPGSPPERAAAAIRALGAGGLTPLAEGLELARAVIARDAPRRNGRRSLALVLTDGRVHDPHGRVADAAARLGKAADGVHVVDTEEGPVRVGLAATIAAAAGGRLHRLRSVA